ncbi:MAG TPA: hypothetical protein VGC41_27510, partial [Kofleriaceae bacterium]
MLHIALIAIITTPSVGELDGYGRSAKAEPVPEVDLKTNCISDAMLANAARDTMCFAPWRGDTDDCLHEAQINSLIDMSGCYAQNEKNVAEISMLDHKASQQVKPIDPEPLLEAMKQEEQKKKPVEVPKPQPDNQPPPPPQPPAAAKPRPMQVVETAKPSEEKAPENARFLAEYDTNVKKQTVARGTPKEQMTAKSQQANLKPTPNPKDASVQEHSDRPVGENKKAPDTQGALSMRKEGPQTPSQEQQEQKVRGSTSGANGPLAADGYVPRKGQGAIEQQQHDRSELPRGENGAGGGAPDVPN